MPSRCWSTNDEKDAIDFMARGSNDTRKKRLNTWLHYSDKRIWGGVIDVDECREYAERLLSEAMKID